MEAIARCVANKQYNIIHHPILTGNITPHDWYEKFTNNRGRPDLPLISVLSEIVYWYRPKRIKDNQTGDITYINKFLGDAWQTSYEHFEKKFGFNREKLRRIFVKLEQMDICYREFRNVKLRGQTYNNRLFIHLSPQFLSSYANNKKFTELKTYENHVKPDFSALKREEGSPHFRGDPIDNENKNNIFKNRSTKSNFCKNSFGKEEWVKKINSSNCNKTRELKDFYPLNKDDCYKLQSLSGREFSLNSMNEILLDMSKRLTDRQFNSKCAFLNYMGKAFACELRDAVKISNNNFKIRNNLTPGEINHREREKYLAEIENSLCNSTDSHLKRKLAAVLNSAKAYDLLKAYSYITRVGNAAYLYLNKPVQLSELDREIVLKQVQLLYQNIDLANDCFDFIEILEIMITNSDINAELTPQRSGLEPVGIWNEMRFKLIDIYGVNVDRNWFSKLEVIENEEKNEINIKAPSAFARDWITQNYWNIIEELAEKGQQKISFC